MHIALKKWIWKLTRRRYENLLTWLGSGGSLHRGGRPGQHTKYNAYCTEKWIWKLTSRRFENLLTWLGSGGSVHRCGCPGQHVSFLRWGRGLLSGCQVYIIWSFWHQPFELFDIWYSQFCCAVLRMTWNCLELRFGSRLCQAGEGDCSRDSDCSGSLVRRLKNNWLSILIFFSWGLGKIWSLITTNQKKSSSSAWFEI